MRGEIPGHEDNEYNAVDSRRSFLKKLGIIGLGAAAAGAGIYTAKESGEKNTEEAIIKIKQGETTELSVPKGFGVDYFYARSGWNTGEGSVDSFVYREAVQQLNQDVDTSSLQENQRVTIPIREGETLTEATE